MNNKGEKVSVFFGDNSFEILVATFSSDSMIPEKAYRVYVAQTDLADEDDDKGKPIIQVCFSPMKMTSANGLLPKSKYVIWF